MVWAETYRECGVCGLSRWLHETGKVFRMIRSSAIMEEVHNVRLAKNLDMGQQGCIKTILKAVRPEKPPGGGEAGEIHAVTGYS